MRRTSSSASYRSRSISPLTPESINTNPSSSSSSFKKWLVFVLVFILLGGIESSNTNPIIFYGLVILVGSIITIITIRREQIRARSRILEQQDTWELASAIMQNPQQFRLMMIDRDFNGNDYDALLGLDQQQEMMMTRGLSDAEIQRLPIFQYSSTRNVDDEKNCAICLENFVDGENIRAIPCLHRFHPQCIDHWLTSKPQCPVCNFPVSFEDE